MQIGLIGGIGPAATDFYYRSLIEKFASGEKNLDMTMIKFQNLCLRAEVT